MFRAYFIDGGSMLRKLVDILVPNVTDGALMLGHDGIRFQSMDSSHIALVDAYISRDTIDQYDIDDVYNIGVSFNTLAKIFKCSSAVGPCTLQYDPDRNGDQLRISFNPAGGKASSFDMKLFDIESERYEIQDEIEQQVQQHISAAEFQKICKDLSTFAEETTIARKGEKLVFTASGDAAKVSMDLPIDIGKGKGKETKGTLCRANYSLRYLSWFAKGQILSPDDCILALDPEKPLLVQYGSPGGDYCLRFYVAAKIEDAVCTNDAYSAGSGDDDDDYMED